MEHGIDGVRHAFSHGDAIFMHSLGHSMCQGFSQPVKLLQGLLAQASVRCSSALLTGCEC